VPPLSSRRLVFLPFFSFFNFINGSVQIKMLPCLFFIQCHFALVLFT
jgi:hypothetical protein